MIRKILLVLATLIILALPTAVFATLQASSQDEVSGAPKTGKDYTIQPDSQPQTQTTVSPPAAPSVPYNPYAYAIPLNSGYKNLPPPPHVEVQFPSSHPTYIAPAPQVIWPQVNNCHVALYCD